LIAGECSKIKRKLPILFRSVELEKTNACDINQVILNFLMKLHGGQTNYEKIKLVLSDQALYAIKVGKLLKDLIPGLKHVTCLCHLIHRLCEEIRCRCKKLNYICGEIKRLLIKNRHNQQMYEITSGLNLPKFSIITRWGTWIEFVCFILDNYNEIKQFALTMSNSENCPYDFFALFTEKDLIEEIKLVKKYSFLQKQFFNLKMNPYLPKNKYLSLKALL
jgi:hypothetical protein